MGGSNRKTLVIREARAIIADLLNEVDVLSEQLGRFCDGPDRVVIDRAETFLANTFSRKAPSRPTTDTIQPSEAL
jgi:hypothetical protein